MLSMDHEFLLTLWITFKLAFFTTLILFVIGLPAANYLAFTRSKFKPFLEAVISMPMVLPPTVIGYYILVAYSPRYFAGAFLERVFDIRLAFSFAGILVASIIFSLPFMIQPIQNGLRSLPDYLREASWTLGKSKTVTFFKVLLPAIRPSVITALAFTFAHTIGEFGIILMVGGNMPGQTRVASVAIYDEVQALNFAKANEYALVLFVLSFILLLVIYSINRKNGSWRMI
jgi:molybdate transport system permease protein